MRRPHDGFQRGQDILAALDLGRIGLGADQHEIVVHHVVALHAVAFGNELLFLRLGVDKHHVGIPAAARVERLACTLCDDLHVDASLFLEHRQDVAEEAGILCRCRRRDDN